jgi:choline-sulfatase
MSISITRRDLWRLAALAGAADSAAQPKKQPNILVLMADQQSPHALGCYGDKVVKSPNLDRLAASGARFNNAYCQAPLCVPSRMSFLTGRQPSENRVWANSCTLASDIPTFAHALGAAGYDTTLIGRMHFNGPDQNHGFATRLVGDLTPKFPDAPIPLTPELRPGATNSSRASVTIAGPGRTAYQAFDEDVTRTTVEFLGKAAKNSNPFLAVAGFVLPHSPFVCSKSDWDYYYDRVSVPKVPAGYLENLHPAVKTWRKERGVEGVTGEETRRARAGYYGLITEHDRNVGRILDALRQTGLEENTMVVYTSDHGEKAGENGMWWKFNFYEGSVTVPLMIALPGRIPGGRVAGEVVGLTDVGPTLCETAGAKTMPLAVGKSLMALITGKTDGWPNEAYSELPAIRGVPATRMYRKGRWKLVHFDGMRPQLFDLDTDPQEFHDLGADPRHAAVRQELLAKALQNWSPADIGREMENQSKNEGMILQWARRTHPQGSMMWQAPPNVNQFPAMR